MLFIDLTIALVGLALILFVITQIIYPLYTGEPFFSLFRKSMIKDEITKAEHALQEVAEVTHLKRVVTEFKRQTAELEKKE